MADSGQRKILLVDDEIDSVRPLIRMLELQGYRTEHAADADTAVQQIEAEIPDLALVDVVLGSDSGFDLFRRIRSLPAGADIPILFLSGCSATDSKLRGLNLGAGDFIIKPYDLHEVVVRIAMQLRLRDNERLLRARNEELSKAYDELREAQAQSIQAEKLATIGRLSAGIAHEMSTPLSFIVSNLKMLVVYMRDIRRVLDAYQELAQACAGELPPSPLAKRARDIEDLCRQVNFDSMRNELRSMARDCLDGCEIIARVADDLREFSRVEYEDMVPADVNLLLDKALNLVRNEMGGRIRVERDFGRLPLMRCIPNRIIQLFLNLFLNAVQAISGEGSVVVKSRATAKDFVITIDDSGCGIPADVMPHIFEPFFTTKAAEKGTGLGLSIAQKIAVFHGGLLSVKSELGKGTHVTISFPLESKSTSAAVIPSREG